MLTVNKKFTIVRLLCAFAIAIALSVAVIFAVSEEPVTAIYNLFLGPLQSKRHFFEVFASSVPLIFTGLALGLVFKSGNFSMIADACLYTGAVVTAALAIKTSLPFAVHPIVIMIAAAAVGGLIGSIPALLKVYFHTNELVTSLMFNYVFFYLGIYNVTKFLADREAGTFASKKYQATASLGKLISGTNFHVGYLIAIAAVILLYILVYKTKFGYEVRISGSNPEFAKYSGIRTSRVIIMTQVIAGAVAGHAAGDDVGQGLLGHAEADLVLQPVLRVGAVDIAQILRHGVVEDDAADGGVYQTGTRHAVDDHGAAHLDGCVQVVR